MSKMTQASGNAAAQNPINDDGFSSAEFQTGAALRRPLALGSGTTIFRGKEETFSYELGQPVNGISKLIVEAQSAAGQLISTIGVAISALMQKPRIAIAVAGIGAVALPAMAEKAKGNLMPDGSNPAPYLAAGSSDAGKLVWFESTFQGTPFFGSGVLIAPEWVLIAAHEVTGPAATLTATEVGTGTNYLTDQGITAPVASVTIYPSYDFTFDTPDLALVHLASPLPFKGITMATTTPSVGQILSSAGFGKFGTPSTGLLAQDGNSRGWAAPVVQGNTSNVSSLYYISTDFDANDHVALNGKGESGDSGGPIFDSSGDLVGINVAQYGDTAAIGGTESLVLSQPDIRSWIDSTMAAPEPSAIAVLGFGAIGLLVQRRRAAQL